MVPNTERDPLNPNKGRPVVENVSALAFDSYIGYRAVLA